MNIREEVLNEALKAVMQDRNQDYGQPEDNFKDIGRMYDIYKEGNKLGETRPHDVAIFMIIVKICRIKQSPTKVDHWVDIAGYSACGYDCVHKTVNVKFSDCKFEK